ncbi:hypothetical protein F5Y14DRAFT_356761 [Nemania sp. NC0429]|nr:hypothetical protein F5Y14DRAFT_356761 [Nemania sp. NC0429]
MAPQVPDPAPTFVPALKPPPGVKSNPDHPDSLVILANIAIGIAIPLVTIFFVLRTYVRVFIKRAWIIEDVLVTIAWAGTIAYCGIMRTTMARHGGQHGWDITSEQLQQASYWFNVAAIEYGVIIGITKLSILCLYRRVFSPHRWSWFDISIVTLIILLVGFYTSTSIAKIFECQPREKIWNPKLPGKCIEIKWILNISGGFNTVTDYLILLLPIHAVRSLKMPKMTRVLVVLAFTFGLAGPIFATVGFVVRLQKSGNPDTSWNQPEILLWGAAELASGNLCVCFPELAVLLRRQRLTPPGRPTPEQVKGWNQARGNPAVNRSLHKYLPKSLMSTMWSSSGEESYFELQDQRHTVKITPGNGGFSHVAPSQGKIIVLRNEVKVEHEERSP